MNKRILRTLAVLPLALGISEAMAVNDLPRPYAVDADERGMWLVSFVDAPLAAFEGSPKVRDAKGRPLAPTAPGKTGARKLDVDSPASQAYLAWLDARHAEFLSQAKAKSGVAMSPRFRYRHAMNGMAIEMTEAQAREMQKMPGVAAVVRDRRERLMTDTSAAQIGADRVWAGTVFNSTVRTRGEGVVVGIVDSGINPTHPSFADASSDGYNHSNPRGRFYGVCQGGSGCNDKLIGIYDYTDEGNRTGRDADGHGTHVASTAAGNPNAQNIPGTGNVTITGVAPRANVISYKVCIHVPDDSDEGGCFSSAILAAVDQATADQVDVLNLSLGSDEPIDPWISVRANVAYYSGALLNARSAGTVVAMAAGNSSLAGTIGSAANSPWVLTVGAVNASDSLAGFSSRGPVLPFGGWLKPDVTAPGGSIDAADWDSNGTNNLSGTSMASPHVAGAAALVISAFPSYNVSQVESSLTTAVVAARVGGTPGTPHQVGSGRVSMQGAVRAPLYFNVTREQFVAADPLRGGRPQDLNRPSLEDHACVQRCRFVRTVTANTGGEWRATARVQQDPEIAGLAAVTITPESFALTAGASQQITIDVDVSDASLFNRWSYGTVALTPIGTSAPETLLPFAVFSDDASLPMSIVHRTTSNAGSARTPVPAIGDVPNFVVTTSALVRNAGGDLSIPADPTNGDPFDSATGVAVVRVTVPAQAPGERGPVVYAALDSQTAVDLDLRVGIDDGSISSQDVLCVSAGPVALEECILDLPPSASPRTIFAHVQNYAAGTSGTDVAELVFAAPQPGVSGRNLVVTGPGRGVSGKSFSLQTAWNEPRMLSGDAWIGLVEAGPDATNPRQFGFIPVVIERSGNEAPGAVVLDPASPNKSVAFDLAPGTAHERIVVDVPPNATAMAVTTAGTGEIDLYVAKATAGDAAVSTIPAAPARGTAQGTSIHAGATERVDLLATGTPALTPGRWYLTPVNTGSTRASATLTVDVTLPASNAQLPLLPWRQNAYFNPSRSGHGVFLSEGAGQRVVIWYTYEDTTAPTWYLAQAAVPDARVGSIWSAPLLRFTWNGTAARGTPVGEVILTRTASNAFTYSWRVDGRYGSENMIELAPQSCPSVGGTATDYSGTWFAPAQAGFGYSVLTLASTEVEVAYLYDLLGNPRWLYGQNSPFGSGNFQLTQFSGFCPTCPFSALTAGTAGTMTRTFTSPQAGTAAVTATLLAPLEGPWSRSDTTSKLTNDLSCQ